MDNNVKFLVFAHHISVIDAIEKYVNEEFVKKGPKIENIRIDGRVDLKKRHDSVINF